MGKAREISCIELSFDPSYDFVYPQRPKSMISSNFHSLIKDYRIYFYDENKKSKLIKDIKDNEIAFRPHSFESITAKGIGVGNFINPWTESCSDLPSANLCLVVSTYSPCIRIKDRPAYFTLVL